MPAELGVSASIAILTSITWANGMPLLDAVRLWFFLLLPTLTLCSIAWRILRPTNPGEQLAALACGSTLAICGVAAAVWFEGRLKVGVSTTFWIVFLLALYLILRPRRDFSVSIRHSTLIAFAPAVVLCACLPVWAGIPANISNSLVYPDWPFHQVIGNAAQIGYMDNPLYAGHAFGYHWLGDGFGVAIERLAELQPLQGISRALYIQASLGATLGAMAIAWTTTRRIMGAIVGALVLAYGCWVFFPAASNILPLATEPSPTYATALPIALCIYAVLVNSWTRQKSSLAILGVLSLFLSVGRVTTAALVVVVIGLAVLVLLPNHRHQWIYLIPVAIGATVGELVFVGSGPSQSLTFQPNLETVRLLGLFPYSGVGSELFGLFALVVLGAGVLVLAIQLARMAEDKISLLYISGGLSPIVGIAASCLTIQAGSSQITFLWAGLALGAIILGPSVVLLLKPKATPKRVASMAILGLAIVATLQMSHRFSVVVGLSGYGRWAMVVVPSILLCALPLISTTRVWSLTFVGALLSAGIVTGLITTVERVIDPQILATPSVYITAQEVEAGKWLAKNSDPREIVATTRQCALQKPEQIPCASAIFTSSALSGLVSDIEGMPYAVGSPPTVEALSRASDGRLAASGDPQALKRLKERGVHWLWVDLRGSSQSHLSADFNNGSVAIIRIR